MEKCMPTAPKVVGREFARRYYQLMNKSPENLHSFYKDGASFIHDDIDPTERRTINADSKMAIRDIMLERIPKYKHTSTIIHIVDTLETLGDGLIVRITGEISFNEQPMRPFSQTIILTRTTPFQYFVQNDIFRFCDFEESDDEGSHKSADCSQTMPTAETSWAAECEEYIAPPDEQIVELKRNQPRADTVCDENDRDADENEVKLDTSDSGLSSDAEKAIMDIQSMNLKNILLETRSITKESVMKRGPTPPMHVEEEIPVEGEMKQNRSELFRDSCILTIGNVINPNIEFDDATPAENATSENDKTQNSFDTSTLKSDENNSGKNKYRKRKDRRKSKNEMSKDKSFDNPKQSKEHNQPNEPNESNKQHEPNMPYEPAVSPIEKRGNDSGQSSPKNEPEKPADTPHSNTSNTSEPETPRTAPEVKTYADLAKAGKAEWVDEMAGKRTTHPPFERTKSRSSMPSRRNSRTDHRRTDKTPPTNTIIINRSPKNDLFQVFIGNIPHDATEDGIRKMFSRFGRVTRLRLHANTRKDWLPLYAFITYDNIQSVRQCLMKKNTFYWPENARDGQKLNVNGDPSIDMWDDSGNQKSNDMHSQTRELRQFSRNFVLDTKESNNKRSPDSDSNISDAVKNERRKWSTRA